MRLPLTREAAVAIYGAVVIKELTRCRLGKADPAYSIVMKTESVLM